MQSTIIIANCTCVGPESHSVCNKKGTYHYLTYRHNPHVLYVRLIANM